MQHRLAKACVHISESVLEPLQQTTLVSTALRGHTASRQQYTRLIAWGQPKSGHSDALAQIPSDKAPQSSLQQRALGTGATLAHRSKGTSTSSPRCGQVSSDHEGTGVANLPHSTMPAPGSVVLGFDDCFTSSMKPPSWAPSLIQGRSRPALDEAHELSSQPLPADPETMFPTASEATKTLPSIRRWRDWLARAKTIERWLHFVQTDLLRPDLTEEAVSYVHVSSASHALSVLVDGIFWRDNGANASPDIQGEVNEAILELARRVEHWPTCNNHEDVASFLWRLQQLCLVKCPAHMKVQRSP